MYYFDAQTFGSTEAVAPNNESKVRACVDSSAHQLQSSPAMHLGAQKFPVTIPKNPVIPVPGAPKENRERRTRKERKLSRTFAGHNYQVAKFDVVIKKME